MLQRQVEVFGASSAEDLRGLKEIQIPEERAGTGQMQLHAGGCKMSVQYLTFLLLSQSKHDASLYLQRFLRKENTR